MRKALARWGAWFRRGWPWWWSVGLATVGGVALYLAPITDDNVRRVGMLYETLGMMLILVEIAAATKKHQLEWPWQRFVRYWGDAPVKNNGRTISVSVGEAVELDDACHMYGSALPPAGATLEQRVTLLEQRLHDVGEIAVLLVNRADGEERARVAAVKAEEAARSQADDRLRESIKALEVGGLDLTMFGLLWLFVGMVMTTGTKELCMALQCVG